MAGMSAGASSDEEVLQGESGRQPRTCSGGRTCGSMVLAATIAAQIDGAEVFEMKMEMESPETFILSVMIVFITTVLAVYLSCRAAKSETNPSTERNVTSLNARAEVMSSRSGNDPEHDIIGSLLPEQVPQSRE